MLTSPKKGETAFHCCDPAISVLIMSVSRNVFHVLSALHSIVCQNQSHRNGIVATLIFQSIFVRMDGRKYVRTDSHVTTKVFRSMG